MKPLFSEEGEAALAALVSQKALYAFDFDGTLSPIVPRPDDAAASAQTVARLSALADLVPVVVITGRSVTDLARRLPVAPRHVVGNHGAEGLPSSIVDPEAARVARDAHAALAKSWLSQWPAAIASLSDDPGIVVEDKTYSLSVHYRHARDPDAARDAVFAAAERLEPTPRRIGGKRVVNLLPADAADKGQALAALVAYEACDTAFFIGDDVTDDVAFAQAPPSWLTVRVGRDAQSAARFFVDDQPDVDRVLDRLVTLLRDRPAP